MSKVLRVACIQNCAARQIEPNIGPVGDLIRAAAKNVWGGDHFETDPSVRSPHPARPEP